MIRTYVLTFLLSMISGSVSATISAQQVADTSYKPRIEKPVYPPMRGSVVMVDEAHYNFHTTEGRYQPFAELLRRDGYIVKPLRSPFNREVLESGKVLVIANALAERNGKNGDWSLPTPSAFSDEEITAVVNWVKGGGSLLLIADHMPFPGAAEKLAAAFGVRFSNGFARDQRAPGEPIIFRRSDGSLKDHAITRGRTAAERVDSVATFTGSAFQAGDDAKPLLTFGQSVLSLMPSVAWQFKSDTPRIPVEGWYQGAVLHYGKGHVAVFGEAAMFTAQLTGPGREPIGMNAPMAKQNHQFLLNVVHWLSGLLKK